LNKGISLAKGKYIARMDADDISLPERFEKQVKFLEENINIDVCGTWMADINNGKLRWHSNVCPVSDEEIKVAMLFNSSIMHPTVLAKKSFFDEYQYNEDFNGAEDYEIWVSSIRIKKYHNIPKALFQYRSGSNTNKTKQVKLAKEIREKYLNIICPDLSSHEIKIFNHIISGQYVRKHKARKLMKVILDKNAKYKVVDNVILKKQLASFCWESINADNVFERILNKLKIILK